MTPAENPGETPPRAAEAAAEQLYGLPLADFTATRNALSREAANEGDREGAEAIRSLRKPSAAAWALNQLARGHRDEIGELVSAGEGLRRAQAELLAGGDRAAFRAASKLEQRLVSELARKALGIARDAGAAATDALERRVVDTLRAAVLDPAVAKSLRAGRLVREHAAAGLPTDGAPSAEPQPKPRRSGATGRDQRRQAAAEQLRQAQRHLRDAERTEASARKRHESTDRQTARLRERAEEALERLRAAEADQRVAADALTKAGEDRLRLARKAEELRRRSGA